jgi:hypothetical protein
MKLYYSPTVGVFQDSSRTVSSMFPQVDTSGAIVNQFGEIHGNEPPTKNNVKALYMDIKIDVAGNIS